MHNCPVDGCDMRVSNDLLMCRRHWRLVSGPTKQRVYRAYNRGAGVGTAALLEAQRLAVGEAERAIAERTRRHEDALPRLPGLL